MHKLAKCVAFGKIMKSVAFGEIMKLYDSNIILSY